MLSETELDTLSGKQVCPSNSKEWRTFERHFGRWLRDNADTITLDEGRPFKRATYDCFALGLCSGIVVSLALTKAKFIRRTSMRHVFSTLIGLYTTTLCMNYQRRPIYTRLLNSPGRMGDVARQILSTARRDAENSRYPVIHPHGSYHTEVGAGLELSNDVAYLAKRVSGDQAETGTPPIDIVKFNRLSGRSRLASLHTGTYKTWEDIRKENQQN